MSEENEESQPRASVTFAVDPDTSNSTPPKSKRRSSMRGSLRSSFFRLKDLVFRRNDGEAGADIATLRGSHGPDFEGNATINRGGGISLSCGCFGGDDKSEKIILIKGAYCFVFADESDQAPKYAIALAHMKAKIQAPSHGVHHVTIEGSLGDVEWELGFADKETAKKFADAFRKQAAIGEADKVRERLGHGKLVNKRSSVKYAESIAQMKLGDAPEKKDNNLLEDVNRGVDPLMAAC